MHKLDEFTKVELEHVREEPISESSSNGKFVPFSGAWSKPSPDPDTVGSIYGNWSIPPESCMDGLNYGKAKDDQKGPSDTLDCDSVPSDSVDVGTPERPPDHHTESEYSYSCFSNNTHSIPDNMGTTTFKSTVSQDVYDCTPVRPLADVKSMDIACDYPGDAVQGSTIDAATSYETSDDISLPEVSSTSPSQFKHQDCDDQGSAATDLVPSSTSLSAMYATGKMSNHSSYYTPMKNQPLLNKTMAHTISGFFSMPHHSDGASSNLDYDVATTQKYFIEASEGDYSIDSVVSGAGSVSDIFADSLGNDVLPMEAGLAPPTADLAPTTADLTHQTADLAPTTADLTHPTADLTSTTADLTHPTADLAPTTADLTHPTVNLAPTTADLTHPTADLAPSTHSLTPPTSSVTTTTAHLDPPSSSMAPPPASMIPTTANLVPPTTGLTPPTSSMASSTASPAPHPTTSQALVRTSSPSPSFLVIPISSSQHMVAPLVLGSTVHFYTSVPEPPFDREADKWSNNMHSCDCIACEVDELTVHHQTCVNLPLSC